MFEKHCSKTYWPQCPLTACVIIAAIFKLTTFHSHYESSTHNQGCQSVFTKKVRPCLKKAKINQIAVLRHTGYAMPIKQA